MKMSFKKIQLVAQIVGLVTILVLCIMGVLALASGNNPASAALGPATLSGVPNVINYQGILRQPDGSVVNGSYTMTFRLYHDVTGGTPFHTDTLEDVVVRDGLFTVLLGDGDDTNPIGAEHFGQPVYVGIRVENDAEMEPRQRIAPVPYAVQLTDGVYVDDSGDVGIGTITPEKKLDVAGDARVSGNADLSGRVGIGTGHHATYNLDVAGDARVSGNVGIGTGPEGNRLNVNGAMSWNGSTMTYEVYHLRDVPGDPEQGLDLGRWDLCAVLSYEVAGEDSSSADYGYCRISFDATADNGWGNQPSTTKAGSAQPNWYFSVGANKDVDYVNCEAICVNLGH
jgi:hypothetical protein